MKNKLEPIHRRRFLGTAASAVATAIAAPYFVPSSALGNEGFVAPSDRLVIGGIGIGNRGTYDLGCFLEQPDVQFVAVCDVKAVRRDAIKKMVDQKYANEDCSRYRDFRELLDRQDIDAVLIATGPNWHCDGRQLRRPSRQGYVLRKALHQKHLPKPAARETRCAAPVGCFKPARSAATCPILPSPANWRGRESLEN